MNDINLINLFPNLIATKKINLTNLKIVGKKYKKMLWQT